MRSADLATNLNSDFPSVTGRILPESFMPWDEVRHEVLGSFLLSYDNIRQFLRDEGAEWYDSDPLFACVQVLGVRHLLVAWCSGFGHSNFPEWHADVFRSDCWQPVYSFRKEEASSPYAGFGFHNHSHHYSRESAIQDLIDWACWYGSENAAIRHASDTEMRFLVEANQVAPLDIFREQAYETRLLHDDRICIGVSDLRTRTVASVTLRGTETGLANGDEIMVCAWYETCSDGNDSLNWIGKYCPVGRPHMEFEVTTDYGFSIQRILGDAGRCRWCRKSVPLVELDVMPGTHAGLCLDCRAERDRLGWEPVRHHDEGTEQVTTQVASASWE